MLKPAALYSGKLNSLFVSAAYDDSNKYWVMDYGVTNFYEPRYGNKYTREYVSVDKDDNVIGYFSYALNESISQVEYLNFISFDKGNLLFVEDVLHEIHKIFTEYNMNSIIFTCIPDNPVYANYIKFNNYCNGKVSGYYKDYCKLMDGKLYDEVVFQIMREDYYESKMYNRMEKKIKRIIYYSCVNVKNYSLVNI